GYNGVFDDCWTPTPSTGFVYRWVSSTGGTPSGLTGPLSGSGGAGQYIYTESSYGTAGAIATVEMPNMQLTDSLLVFSFDYHMTGATMGNLYAEYDAGSGWVTFDSIIGQQQTSQSAAWITHNSLLTNPTGVFNIRLRGVRGASFTGDIAFDNASVDVLACMDPSGLSASNVSNTSFDVAWSSINSSPLSYEVRYRSTGATTYMSNGASVSIAGLTAGTSYDVSVREICAVGDTSGWSADLTVSTLLCAATDQCQYMVYMTDSYGDGWNGNQLVFTQSGVAVGTLGAGFTTGSAATDSISLCDLASATVTLNLGSWSGEIGFDVVGPYGDTVLTHTSGTTLT
ncbi:MAG: fibronectin type III domain-containing protein, partial [Flavobacteriales bacterium]|nr:fibronectin type III domain-containing protein [Flavobacteriales bacterium]